MGFLDTSSGRTPHSNYLPSVKPDQELTPKFIGKIIQAVDNSTPRFGAGYQVVNYSGGSVLRIPTPNGSAAAPFNFQVSAFIEKGVCYATISVGTVNRVVPKIVDKYMDELKNDLPPLLICNSPVGYIVIEVTAQPNKPFPSTAEIKYVTTITDADTSTKSIYVLAKVTGTPPTKDAPAKVDVSQYHLAGNMAVNRFKIGASTVYFQWYVV